MITIKQHIKYNNRQDKDLADFVVSCTKLFDSIYDEEPILTLKESSSGATGGYNRNHERVMNISLASMQSFYGKKFFEYYNYHWWSTTSTNPYFAIYLLAIHEYSHIVTFSRHKFKAKAHGRKFYNVCQEIESSISFDSCFSAFRKSRVIF